MDTVVDWRLQDEGYGHARRFRSLQGGRDVVWQFVHVDALQHPTTYWRSLGGVAWERLGQVSSPPEYPSPPFPPLV
jgi:hypothetical protein